MASRQRMLVIPSRQSAARIAALFQPIPREAQSLLAGYSDRDLELIGEFLTHAAKLPEKHGNEIAASIKRAGS